MILESLALGGAVTCVYAKLTKDIREEKRFKQFINTKWDILMDGLGSNKSENKIEQPFEILKIIRKGYGTDLVVSIPWGKKYTDIIAMLPALSNCFKSEVMCNLSPDKSSAYIRMHFINHTISSKDNLKFNFFKTFSNLDGCVNKDGETLYIEKIEEIKSPTDELVGYKVGCKIPLGVKYENIKNSYDTIIKTMGKCFMWFNYNNMMLELSIIHNPLNNKTKFYPIKVKPWELYFGMGHDWKPIIADYSLSANTLDGGSQGTGKTVALISAFINLCTQCEEDFKLMVAMAGEKSDLRVFKEVKQCDYYASDLDEVLKLLKYLKKEMDRRNKLFASLDSFVFNVYEYNEVVDEKDKLPIIHFLSDEIADFMSNNAIHPLLWDIIRKSRSAGIYFTVATQRASVKNLSPEFKAQLKNSVSFYQPNVASALTVANGEDMAKKVISLEKSREFVCSYFEGVKTGKTLFLDRHMMEELLKPVIVKNKTHLNLDKSGNIIEETDKKQSKISRFEQKYNKEK